MQRLLPILLLLVLISAGPSTVPASLSQQISQWFEKLNDDDASVRQQARVALMGMSRSDLDVFHDVVSHCPMLSAAQRSELEAIVKHVVAATEPYTEMSQGFLGLQWDAGRILQTSTDAPASCLPGTCAARVLREGDIVMGLRNSAGFPEVKVFRNNDDLTTAVSALSPHAEVELLVMRLGQEIAIPIRLDAKPQASGNSEQIRDLLRARVETADKIWSEQFEEFAK